MKTYIWSLPTRISHWLVAIGFATAYILGDFEKFQNFHFAFGALVGTLIFFRLLFGLFGPKYSIFSDFPIGLGSQKEFIKTYFSKPKIYPGHNPAASVIMLSIFLVGITCSISGYLLYANENNVINIGTNEDFLGESHEVMANLFLFLVGIHLIGILSDTIFHGKNGTLQSIFTGYKNIETKSAELNGFQKTFSAVWLIIPFFVFHLANGLQINSKEKKENKTENNESHEHEDHNKLEEHDDDD